MVKKKYPNLYNRDGVWYYEFVKAGQRFRGSCHTHLVTEALDFVAEIKAKAKLGQSLETGDITPGAAPKIYPTLGSMFERHAAKIRRERRSSENTIETDIKCRWKRLAMFYRHMGEVTPDSIPQYIDFQLRRGIRATTIKKDLWSIRLGNQWACKLHPELEPIIKLPRLAVDDPGNKAGRALSDEDLQAWLKELTPQNRAIALVTLLTGLRSRTIRSLDASFIELTPKDRVLAAKLCLPGRVMKAKRQHQVGLTHFGLRLVRQILPFVHQNPKKNFITAARKAGIESVSMHDLRHTFATRMGRHDAFGTELVLAHRVGGNRTSATYHHVDDERLGFLAQLAEKTFAKAWKRASLELVATA